MDDLIRRNDAIDAVEHITSSMSVCVNSDECHGMKRMQRQAVIELTNMPSVQPEKRTENTRKTHACDLIDRQAAIEELRKCQTYLFDEQDPDKKICLKTAEWALEELPSSQPEPEKYEYHYDHTDCIWYRPEARNRCPVTCAQYRDGWNDAMNYIYRDGKGYRPYRRDSQYGE